MEENNIKITENENINENINMLQVESIKVIISLIHECQKRGAYSLEEAGLLFQCIQHFSEENKGKSSNEDQRKSVVIFIEHLDKAQKKGLLEMEESYNAWKAIQVFIPKS